jgi:hypothetical protein
VVVYTGNKPKEYSVKKQDAGNTGALFNCDTSQEVDRQTAAVVSLGGDKAKE